MHPDPNLLKHPLIRHKISHLRQSSEIVSDRDYERIIYEITLLMAYEITKNIEVLPISEGKIQNGKEWLTGERVQKMPVIVAVVRSGLVMAEAMRSVISTPYMGHVGVFEDSNGITRSFMTTMPDDLIDRDIIICDFAILRGNSAKAILELIDSYGVVKPKNIHFCSIFATQEGIEKICSNTRFTGINFYCAKRDQADDSWKDQFLSLNRRLYRTLNLSEIE